MISSGCGQVVAISLAFCYLLFRPTRTTYGSQDHDARPRHRRWIGRSVRWERQPRAAFAIAHEMLEIGSGVTNNFPMAARLSDRESERGPPLAPERKTMAHRNGKKTTRRRQKRYLYPQHSAYAVAFIRRRQREQVKSPTLKTFGLLRLGPCQIPPALFSALVLSEFLSSASFCCSVVGSLL